MITLIVRVQLEKSLLQDLHLIAVLNTWCNLHFFRLAVNSLHLNVRPQNGINNWNFLLHVRVVALSLEHRMFPYSDFHNEVAVDVPLAFESESGSVVDAPGDFEFLTGLDNLHAFAWAVIAGLSDGLPSSVAVVALSAHDHDSLMKSHESSSLARVAFLGFTARLCPGSLACTACASALQLDYLHLYRLTFEVPLTASLKSMSYFSVMSSLYSSTVLPPERRPRFPPPMPPPKRS